jgi:hypothetical protein
MTVTATWPPSSRTSPTVACRNIARAPSPRRHELGHLHGSGIRAGTAFAGAEAGIRAGRSLDAPRVVA